MQKQGAWGESGLGVIIGTICEHLAGTCSCGCHMGSEHFECRACLQLLNYLQIDWIMCKLSLATTFNAFQLSFTC